LHIRNPEPLSSAFCPLTSVNLSIGQQQPYFSLVGFGNDVGLPQGAFPFGGFLGQDMATVGFSKDKFPGAGFLKPFGSGTIGFNFGHRSSPSPAGLRIYGGNHI
jgi:hypothetical protein